MTGEKKFYDVLDGLRGVAAALIVMRHSFFLWGSSFELHSSYLAVDLFFVLSGFVLAHAYEKRFEAGMGALDFLRIRFIRLAPLSIFGLAWGFLLYFASMKLSHEPLHPIGFIAVSLILNASMLPAPPGWSSRSLGFPFNGPTWSLFFEMVVNGLYAATYRWLTLRVLAGGVLIAAGGLILSAFGYGALDLGIEWAEFPGGLARVMFSFPLGIIIYRSRMKLEFIRINPWLLIAFMVISLWLPVGAAIRPYYDLLVVILILPAIIAAGARSEAKGMSSQIFRFLGRVSFAIYVLHAPFVPAFGWVAHHALGIRAEDYLPWSGIAFLSLVILFGHLCDRLIDEPARQFLTGLARRYRFS
jgi:peptidoglycan/LPS O-acetylase OafA/YrhL